MSAATQVPTKVPDIHCQDMDVAVRLPLNLAMDRLVRELTDDTIPRLPDGMGDADETWTYVENVSNHAPVRWRLDGMTVEAEIFRVTRSGYKLVNKFLYLVHPVDDVRSRLQLKIENKYSRGLIYHCYLSIALRTLARRMMRAEPRKVNSARPGTIRKLTIATAFLIVFWCVILAPMLLVSHHHLGTLAMGLTCTFAIGGWWLLRTSRSSARAAIRSALITGLTAVIVALWIRLESGSTLTLIVGAVVIAWILAAAFVATALSAMQRNATVALASALLFVLGILLSPGMLGTSAKSVGFPPLTSYLVAGFPQSSTHVSVAESVPPNTPAHTTAQATLRGGVGTTPPLNSYPHIPEYVNDRLRPLSLPATWQWCWNTNGGNGLTSRNPALHVDTTSDYAVRGFATDDLAAEWQRTAADHRPGYRAISQSASPVFGGITGVDIGFNWQPSDAGNRLFHGETQLVVFDRTAYTAVLIWSDSASGAELDEGRHVLNQLRISDDRHATGTT